MMKKMKRLVHYHAHSSSAVHCINPPYLLATAIREPPQSREGVMTGRERRSWGLNLQHRGKVLSCLVLSPLHLFQVRFVANK